MNITISFCLGLLCCCSVYSGPQIDRQSELLHLLKHDCGSCHGMTLKGGLGPSLLPEAIQQKNSQYLKQVISDGIPNTPMPPWKSMLSDADIQWIVEQLQNGVPR